MLIHHLTSTQNNIWGIISTYKSTNNDSIVSQLNLQNFSKPSLQSIFFTLFSHQNLTKSTIINNRQQAAIKAVNTFDKEKRRNYKLNLRTNSTVQILSKRAIKEINAQLLAN